MKGLILFAVMAAGLAGQDLTGRQVRVLLDMPGDDSGVDVPVDLAVVSQRVSKYGAAIKKGQLATVTLVKKKGDHIEVHLNGGGFTNKELLLLPSYDSPRWGMSDEERRIRSSITGTRDKDRRRRYESEFDRVRARRVKPLRDPCERELRAEKGSRFNVRRTVEELVGKYLELR